MSDLLPSFARQSWILLLALLGGGWMGAAQAEPPDTPRSFYFHHWQLQLEEPLTHATEGLWLSRWSPGTTLAEELTLWRERGVIAQQWRGGRWAYENGFETPEKLAEHWRAGRQGGFQGIVIDEITVDEAQRRVAGAALLELAASDPDLHVAVYIAPGITEGVLAEGLRRGADRVLIETYQGSAISDYGLIGRRWASAIEHDLAEKSLVVLGLGPEWITTARELRRQLHHVRYHFPEMNGIAFFGNLDELHPGFAAEIDALLGLFYTRPVLRVERSEGGALVFCNIGAVASPPIELALGAAAGESSPRTLAVPALAVNASAHLDAGAVSPEHLTVLGADWTVLGPPSAWGAEPDSLRAGAGEPWPDREETPWFSEAFASPWQGADATEAIFPWPGTADAGFQVELELVPHRIPYGVRYGFDWGHDDTFSGPGIALDLARRQDGAGTRVYFTLLTRSGAGWVGREDIALPVEPNERYQVRVQSREDGAVRVAIQSHDSDRGWHTGWLPGPPALSVDRMRLSDRDPRDSSVLQWDESAQRLVMISDPQKTGSPHAGLSVQSIRAWRAAP